MVGVSLRDLAIGKSERRQASVLKPSERVPRISDLCCTATAVQMIFQLLGLFHQFQAPTHSRTCIFTPQPAQKLKLIWPLVVVPESKHKEALDSGLHVTGWLPA